MSNTKLKQEEIELAEAELPESYTKAYLISAGHSDTDCGAVNGKVTEAQLVTELRNIVVKKLKERGVKNVITDGEGSENQPLSKAIKLITNRIAYEFHFNAAENKGACGVETISQPRDVTMSQKISQAIAGVLGTKVRGDKGFITQTHSQHSRLGYVMAGGTIVEVCFISNDKELANYQAKKYLVAEAFVKAILGEK